MVWLRRAPGAALALALAVAASGFAACGEEASQTARPPGCAPSLYEFIRKKESYPAPAVAAARGRDEFNLQGTRVRLAPPVDWGQDPSRSVAFQSKLHGFSWVDPLLGAYRAGDRGALAQARDLALDWIGQNTFVNPYLAETGAASQSRA